MKPLEFAEKQLKNEEKKLAYYLELFELYADEHDLKVLKEQVEKVKRKREKVERVKNAPQHRLFQELQKAYWAMYHEKETE